MERSIKHAVCLPFASFSMKCLTLGTVRLKAMTLKPWSAAFMIRFWPMTARPIRPKSPLGSERAGEPTLMPASRALTLAIRFGQSSCSMSFLKGYLKGSWHKGWSLARSSGRYAHFFRNLMRLFCGEVLCGKARTYVGFAMVEEFSTFRINRTLKGVLRVV